MASWFKRRPADPPSAWIQTMLLPNGQFLLVFSELCQGSDGAGLREYADQLPQMTGAAAVLIFDGPVTVLSAEPAAAPPATGLTVMENYREA